MNNKKSTKRALLMSVLSLLVCMTMLIGSTFAWFTDSVTSKGNIIKSGTLDIALEKWDGDSWEDASTAPIFNYAKWEPGYTEVVNLRVVNNGNLALIWEATITTEKTLSKLADVINVYVRSDDRNDSVKDYIDGITDRTQFAELAEQGQFKKFTLREFVTNLTVMTKGTMEPGQESYLGLVLQMDTAAGNEYQGLDLGGEFDLSILATQYTYETDSFDKTYDAEAAYPLVAWATKPVDKTAQSQELPLMKANGAKAGSALIPTAAIADDSENVSVDIKETKVDTNVTVEDNQEAKTYNIEVTGLKENNNVPVKIELNVGKGLTGVKLFHNDVQVTNASYNSVTGMITFESASFSPYTVTYDRVAADPEVEMPDKDVPVAKVTDADEYENVAIAWTGWGGFNPSNKAQQLETVYLFEAQHTSESVEKCAYKNWYCDYYVKLVTDKMDVLPEGMLTLGGNYDGYGWVGFDNPEVEANKAIPLLGSVMNPGGEEATNSGWTYSDVVKFVNKFWCGVSRTEAGKANEALNGAQFVVELRITNPENPDDYINVNTVTYTFGK